MKEIARLCLILGVLILVFIAGVTTPDISSIRLAIAGVTTPDISSTLLAMGPSESAAEEMINFNLEYLFPDNQYSDCYLEYAGKFIAPLMILLNISPANSKQLLFKSYDVSFKFFIVTSPVAFQLKPVIAIMLDKIRFPVWTIVIDPGDSEEEIKRKASTAAGVVFLRIKNLEELINWEEEKSMTEEKDKQPDETKILIDWEANGLTEIPMKIIKEQCIILIPPRTLKEN